MPKLYRVITAQGELSLTEEQYIELIGEEDFRASRIPPIPESEMTPADHAFRARMQDPFDED